MIGICRNLFSNDKFVTRSFIGGFFIWTLALAAPGVAPASVIFTNFGAGLTYNTTGGNPVGNAFDGNNYGEGDTFTSGANKTFGSVSVALSCSFGCPEAANFTVALTADAGDTPGAVIESFTFPAMTLGAVGANNAPVTATSVLKPLLTAGNQYWITVVSSLTDSIAWNWNSTNDASDEALSVDGGASWFSPSGLTPGAFEVDSTVTSAVPEPGAGPLIGAGLLIGVLYRRARSRVRPW